jgi:membrane fusion protein, multidrug efflux system
MSVAEKKPVDPIPVGTAAPEAKTRGKGRRRVLMFGVPVLLLLGGGYAWLTGGRYMETDNAYVHQPLVPVSADVVGRIVEVNVAENSKVAVGDPLFSIDSTPYDIALAQADAALASARLSVAQLRANYATVAAQVQAAEGILDVQKRELGRQDSLSEKGLSPATTYDEAIMDARQAENAVKVAQQQLNAAAAALAGNPDIATDDVPSVRAAIAQLDAAARNLEKTRVLAPIGGVVSQIDSLNVGQYLGTGSTVASLVNTDDSWIEANFKETQLTKIAVGQPVEIDVDAYPDLHLSGAVESIGAATGSQFSLIPAQNATGNWVKVVQRIPVRIRIDSDTRGLLRDGMSVAASVDTGKTHLDNLR